MSEFISEGQYQMVVQSLFKDGHQIIQDIERGTITAAALGRLHAAVGLVGECAELVEANELDDEANFEEELGDTAFYLEALRQLTVEQEVPVKFRDNLHAIAADMLDLAKKEAIYGNALTKEQVAYFGRLVAEFTASFMELLNYCEIASSKVRAKNVEKLRKRYPNLVYSNKAAAERADKNV